MQGGYGGGGRVEDATVNSVIMNVSGLYETGEPLDWYRSPWTVGGLSLR